MTHYYLNINTNNSIIKQYYYDIKQYDIKQYDTKQSDIKQ